MSSGQINRDLVKQVYFEDSAQRRQILTGRAGSYHEEGSDSLVYYEDEKLVIRNMEAEDARIFQMN